MGGLLRSLNVVQKAREEGIPVIIGAQVGETSVLTRAGLTAAQAAGDSLLAQEGAFGVLLLASDVAEPPLMFGREGVLDADALELSKKDRMGACNYERQGIPQAIPGVAVFSDTKMRDGFYRFLQVVFHLYPEDRFHHLNASPKTFLERGVFFAKPC